MPIGDRRNTFIEAIPVPVAAVNRSMAKKAHGHQVVVIESKVRPFVDSQPVMDICSRAYAPLRFATLAERMGENELLANLAPQVVIKLVAVLRSLLVERGAVLVAVTSLVVGQLRAEKLSTGSFG